MAVVGSRDSLPGGSREVAGCSRGVSGGPRWAATGSESSNVGLTQCPLCQVYFDKYDIEFHASQCAEERYPQQNDSSDEDAEIHGNSESNGKKDAIVELFSVEKFRQIVKIETRDTVKLRVKRGLEFECFIGKFSKDWAKRKLGFKLVVEYTGEIGIDQGGPKREFFCESLAQLRPLFNDDDIVNFPRPELTIPYADNHYFIAAVLISYSLSLNGPAPTFLTRPFYNYLLGGRDKVLEDLPPKLKESGKLASAYNRISACKTTSDLNSFLITEDGIDAMDLIGHRSVRATIEEKDYFLKSIFLKQELMPSMPMLEQFKDGLIRMKMLTKIHENPEVFRPIFVKDDQNFEWDFSELEDSMVPDYAAEGTTKRARQNTTMRVLLEALDTAANDPAVYGFSFKRFMKWLTGTDVMPPTGLTHLIGIEFVDECPANCACRPAVSTCSIALKLALHYDTEDKIGLAIKGALEESHGFDDL